MEYKVDFGTLAARPAPLAGGTFRLAVLGDFSGRANAGTLETGAALAARKPLAVDVDSIDAVLGRLALTLALDLGEGNIVSVPIKEMDDFHPDQLVENVEMLESLVQLRRNLGSAAGFARASKEVLSWGGEEALPMPPRQARGAAIATDRKLSDFARLTGRAAAPATAEEGDVDTLLRRLVGPYIQPAQDARQDRLTARVDEAASAALRRILHHPDFQAAEALWRGVELLVRRIETGATARIVLYDVSAEEIAADVAAADDLKDCGLYGMLVEQPQLDAAQGVPTAVLGLYGFELSPPHADLLGRIAQVAAAAGAPFLAAIAPDGLQTPLHDANPLVRQAWAALRAFPAAAYLGLASPRFLLRLPYGKRTDPIDAFPFEEFTRAGGLAGMLWGNPALVASLLLAQGWLKQGAKMVPGSAATVGEMPFYVYVDKDGDQVALPCTERMYTERQAVQAAQWGVMPLLSLRGRTDVRLGSFASVAGTPLAGAWNKVEIKPPAPPPPPPPAPVAAPLPEPVTPPAPLPVQSIEPAPTLVAPPIVPVTAPPPIAEPEPEPAAAEDDLDALLASLNAEPAATAPDDTEADLDALLASLA